MLQIKIDDIKIRNQLKHLQNKLHDMRPIMRETAAIIKNSVRRNFELGGRPKWVLSGRVKRDGGTTLIRTGILQRSIQSHYNSSTALVGTNLEYAAIHQFGGQTRAHIIRARDKKSLKFSAGGQTIFRRAVHHPGSRIPARPFILLQDEDKAEILNTVKKYLGEE